MNLKTECTTGSESSAKPSDKEIMIPKRRFDEVNRKYIDVRERVSVLEEEIRVKDETIAGLKEIVEEVESQYASEKTLLELKEIFVEGGFKKSEYEGIVSRISCPDKEDALGLAREIVKIKNCNQ